MNEAILAINSGSSNIKFSLFAAQQDFTLLHHGETDGLKALFDWLNNLSSSLKIKVVGHRIVHGGTFFFQPTLITDEVMRKMQSLIPLAPLHQPHNLESIEIIRKLYPMLPQVACFDTAFHHTQEKLARLFAIPKELTDAGIIRYGFHGLSYEYIASIITDHLGEIGNQRVIVAHLGNGASMCALRERKSVATSMGFTALDGLMMGTRCGRIDPGVLLYLMEEKHYGTKQLKQLLYHESGLLGVSGISSDMRILLASQEADAQEAIELFCYRAATEFGALFAALNGCDALVFTAGIGEHNAIIRKKICAKLTAFGVKTNDQANENNLTIVSDKDSKIVVSIIPTNEELMLAKHAFYLKDMTHDPHKTL